MSIELEKLERQIQAAPGEKEKVDIILDFTLRMGPRDMQAYGSLIERAHKISAAIAYEKGIAYSLFGRSFRPLMVADYEKALTLCLEAREIFRKQKYPEGESRILTQLGNMYRSLGDLDKALNLFMEARTVRKESRDRDSFYYNEAKAWNLDGIANIYCDLGDLEYAIIYYRRSLPIFRHIHFKFGESRVLTGIGTVYQKMEKYEKALKCHYKSLDINRGENNDVGIARSYTDIGSCFEYLHQYEKALDYNTKSLDIRTKLNFISATITNLVAIGRILLKQDKLAEAEEYLQKAVNKSEAAGLKIKSCSAYQSLAELYKKKEMYQKALEFYKKYHDARDKIFGEESNSKIKTLQITHQIETSEKEAEIYRLKNIALTDANKEIKKQSLELDRAYSRLKTQHDELIASKKEIQLEREKSETLLLNILPHKIVTDLKETGKTEPETFNNVSVFFSDFVGFTETAASLSPKVLIDELSRLFSRFDEIMEAHGGERIKTIGDAYLAVCGMPEPDPAHARNLIAAAIDIIRYLNQRNKTGPLKWEIRAGIHSGEVVGGVVGTGKYIYDVFGDTINTASRMENHCEAMKINVSAATYETAKQDYRFEKRETAPVKGKGQMKMYYVNTSMATVSRLRRRQHDS